MSNSARILIVDDDREILKTFSTLLKDAGYMVDTAETGRDAIEKSKDNFYNVALIDIRLPDMEGTKLLTALKETAPKMIKIIVTGYPSLQNAVQAVNKGADRYIIKPAKTEVLLDTIREHLLRQQEAKRYGERKISEFLETRVRELDTEGKQPSNRP
ncbi:MAG: response regulator [Candidatus Bathyarchaeia archaeon]